jgi:hypothetical protein
MRWSTSALAVTFPEDALLLPAFPVTQYRLGGWCLQKLFDQTL